jgi:hypothetical protein
MRGQHAGALAVTLIALGCQGQIGGSDGRIADPEGIPAGDPGDPGRGGPSSARAVELPRVIRLSHAQYAFTIRDLFGDDVGVGDLPPDPTHGGFDNDAKLLSTDDASARAYRRVAEAIGDRIGRDAPFRDRVFGCRESACLRVSIAKLGRRILRRPLRDTELDRYVALHARGPELVGASDPFVDGVRLVVEALLQDPEFLHRVEPGTTLGPHALAARLSFAIWSSSPDDALLDAADRSELEGDRLEREVSRMLDDPRARRASWHFHRQWLEVDAFANVSKDRARFPSFDPSLRGAMEKEVERFVTEVSASGSFADLMTAPWTFAEPALAALYGATPSGGKVALDPAQRAGLLTQIGFLASHANATETSPILRGAFVAKRLLCMEIPPPPNDVDFTPPKIDGRTIRTRREQVELQTGKAPCVGCHQLFNGYGFALEGYDALGGIQTHEGAAPIDTSADVLIDARTVRVEGGPSLARAIATSETARRCYAQAWLRFLSGRATGAEDASVLTTTTQAMASPSYRVRDLVGALVTNPSFRVRPDAP